MTQQLTASRLKAADAARQIEAAGRLEKEVGATISEAKDLIETARREARRVQELARAETEQRDTALRGIAAETVDRYLDTKRIEAAAVAAARLIHDAGSIRAEFDALTPWLTEFLRNAIEGLVGTLGDTEVLSRLVGEGVATLKDARRVTVLVHPGDLAQLQAAREAYPLRFSGVSELRTDARLQPGAVSLESDGGVIDASLTTQIDILCRELEALE